PVRRRGSRIHLPARRQAGPERGDQRGARWQPLPRRDRRLHRHDRRRGQGRHHLADTRHVLAGSRVEHQRRRCQADHRAPRRVQLNPRSSSPLRPSASHQLHPAGAGLPAPRTFDTSAGFAPLKSLPLLAGLVLAILLFWLEPPRLVSALLILLAWLALCFYSWRNWRSGRLPVASTNSLPIAYASQG